MPGGAAGAEQCGAQSGLAWAANSTLENLAPGIPLNGLGVLLRQVDRGPPVSDGDFPAEEMKRAAALVPGPDPAPDDGGYGEYNWARTVPAYSPSRPATDAQREAYRVAATLYWKGDLAAAAAAFDSIAGDEGSPYAAAAAYSAARATLRRGELAAGIDRIAAITRDPRFAEFDLPARHLLGTLSYRDPRPGFVAAKYAQEMHALLVREPDEDDDERRVSRGQELADLDWYLTLYRSSTYDGTPTVLDRLAQGDARFDLLRALAAPTPFQEQVYGGYRWSYPLVRLAADGTLAWDESTPYADLAGRGALIPWSSVEGRELTAHARAQWLRSQNLLWGLAFARRTDSASDSPLLLAMLAKADALPGDGALSCAKQPLVLHFLSQAVRLAIVDERAGEARALIERYRRYLVPPVTGVEQYSPNARMAWRTSAVVEAPIVYYLRLGDYASAREWQARMRAYVGPTVGEQWHVLLATSYSAALAPTSDNPFEQSIATMPVNSAFDMLPVSRLVSIARLPEIPAPARRALVGAAWVRSFALDRPDRRDALLPDMRASFPELARELDRVERARSPAQRRFEIARILLANPGLGVHPSRLHEFGRYLDRAKYSYAVPRDLRAIDPANPNDGNWWCPLDENRLRGDLAAGFFLSPTATGVRDDVPWNWPAAAPEQLQLADQLIARHPLLSGVDSRELAALGAMDSGPEMLSRVVFEWMDRLPRNGRSPEQREEIAAALHDIVRSTRYGCRRAGSTADISREAFRRLHTQFPDSPWARRTPHWFDR
jgi:hypothetical protein